MAGRNFPNGPWTVQGTTGMSAEAEREMLRSLILLALEQASSAACSGVVHYAVAGGDLYVTATPGDSNVHVAAGQCFINGTSGAFQGCYHGSNDASVTLAVAAASTTLPRHDLVIATISDATYIGGSQTVTPFQLSVVTGTPASSPVDPAVPVSSLVLARIVLPAVPSGSTQIAQSWITDLRVPLRRVSAGVHMSGSMSDTNGVMTALSLDTVDWDSQAAQYGGTASYNNSTYTYTCPVPGIYEVQCSVETAHNSTGDHIMDLYKNAGFAQEMDRRAAPTAGGTGRLDGTFRLYCNTGDTLQVQIQTPGSTAAAISGGYATFSLWSF